MMKYTDPSISVQLFLKENVTTDSSLGVYEDEALIYIDSSIVRGKRIESIKDVVSFSPYAEMGV